MMVIIFFWVPDTIGRFVFNISISFSVHIGFRFGPLGFYSGVSAWVLSMGYYFLSLSKLCKVFLDNF